MNAFTSIRDTRNAAKAVFSERLALVRGDLETRSVGGRIVDKIAGESADAALEVVEVVEEHKAIVAGTMAMIGLWFLRNPIVAAVRHVSHRLKRRRGAWS